jgi:hypothetical protein
MEITLRFKGFAVIVAAALLASCAGQGTGNPPTRGTLMRIDQDPTLQATREYLKTHPFKFVRKVAQNGCGGMLAVRHAQFCVNATPTPQNFNWEFGFITTGSSITATYGNYRATVSGGGSLPTCINATAHTLAADATTMATTLGSAVRSWQNDANAAQLEDLLSGYAAGEIGAAAFLAGVVSIDVLAATAAALTIGLTLWSIIDVANCMTRGTSSGYAMGRRRTA